MSASLSRRTFFGQAAVGAVVPGCRNPPPPSRAWVIAGTDWEYNDEYSYAVGTRTGHILFYDRDSALAECQRLNTAFFTVEFPTPADFEPDWELYGFRRSRDFDETAVTWDELRAAGFPDPYQLHELVGPGGFPDE